MPIDHQNVEPVFERIAQALAGEPTETALAALASVLASSASALASDRHGAVKILEAINTDATAMVEADFDFFRMAAQHHGARQ